MKVPSATTTGDETRALADRVEWYAKISRQLLLALVILISLISIALALPLELGSRGYVFPIVMSAGVIGGFVSLQRRLKNLSDDDLQLLSRSRVYIWLSPFVGGVLALVLYLIFLSGLLAGDLFPQFVYDKDAGVQDLLRLFHMRSEEPKEYAKLFFWSFVAGFSEMFVVNIIGSFEKSADRNAPTGPARTANVATSAAAGRSEEGQAGGGGNDGDQPNKTGATPGSTTK